MIIYMKKHVYGILYIFMRVGLSYPLIHMDVDSREENYWGKMRDALGEWVNLLMCGCLLQKVE